MSSSADGQRWSVAEAAVLAEVSVAQVRSAAARRSIVIDSERVSDDDVIRMAALDRFAGGGRLARRRTRSSLGRLALPSTPYFLMCHPNGVVVAVDPERVVEYVSRAGEFTGFDPAPIRQRMGLAWPSEAAPASS